MLSGRFIFDSDYLKKKLSESYYIDEKLADEIYRAFDEGRVHVKWFVLRTEENEKRIMRTLAELANIGFRYTIEKQQSLYNRNPEFDDAPPDTYVSMQYYIINIYF